MCKVSLLIIYMQSQLDPYNSGLKVQYKHYHLHPCQRCIGSSYGSRWNSHLVIAALYGQADYLAQLINNPKPKVEKMTE